MEPPSAKTTIYEPDMRQRDGFAAALRHLWQEIANHRWHIALTFRRDFFLASRLARLGQIWNYVLPLVPITVYICLMALRVFPSFGAVSGIVYVAVGVTLWFLYAGLVQLPVSTLEGKFRELSRTQFPVIAAVVAAFAQLVFETAVRLCLVVLLFAIFQGLPSWQLVFLPLILLSAFVFFFAVGLILALYNLAYRDISKVLRVVLQYGIFLSGVIFPVSGLPVLRYLEPFNPFYVYIESVRTLLVSGSWPLLPSLIGFTLVGLALFALAARAFYVLELRLRGLV